MSEISHSKYFSRLLLSISLFIVITPYTEAQTHSCNYCTKAKLPITAKSNEATKKQLKDARAEGDSVEKCTQWILNEVGTTAGTVRAGEYKIAYAITPPEGWYEFSNNAVTWKEPAKDAKAHLYLFVLDGADGRIVPSLDIHTTILNSEGNVVDYKALPYTWIPMINGYGDNIKLTGNDDYTIKVKIQPPTFHRHDPYNGDRFTQLTEANITVHVNTHELAKKKPLSELMEQHQNIAKLSGKAFKHTLKDMYKQANDGKDTIAGDYFVAVAVEYAEGWWHYAGDKFRYKIENEESGKTNAHVEVAICDAKTTRFMHDMNVQATLYEDSKSIGTKHEPFMWHPWLYHYGENWRVPMASKHYRIHVHFDPPPYKRYGRLYGKQFTDPVDLDFDDIHIKTGQK
ncbi:MAG: iron transporter [Flavipsychrobacter sp.]